MAATTTNGTAIGSIQAMKDLYNHSTSHRADQAKWSEIQDPILEDRRLKALGESHIIVRRFSRVRVEDAWTVASIELKSPRLRSVFDRIFHDYPSWYPDGSPYTFFPPYKPLVHRWDRILKASETEADDEVKKELQIFLKEVEPLVATNMSAAKEAKRTGVIDFEQLWLVYGPGDLMVAETFGNECMLKLVGAVLVKPEDEEPRTWYWQLSVGRTEWNGSEHGFAVGCRKITYFDQPRSLRRLSVFPFEFAPSQDKLAEKMLSRGRKWEALRGYHVKTCTGKKFVLRCDEWVSEPVNGRVIVDAHAFYHCQNVVADQLVPNIVEHTSQADSEDDDEIEMYDDGSDSETQVVKTADDDRKKGERKENLTRMTDEECMTASPLVKGFDLRAKEWCQLNVSELNDIVWNESPYQNLVLKDGEKDLVMAFADHQAHKTGFDDFVEHKGEGVIILLCGPPGVGKTLTAEAVAEKSRVPLYILSAGELGSTPKTLEAALKNALTCCQLWGAMLLLDEADVFLEARSSNSLERNELVAIFLRQLEYYQGLLFLTTNRISTMDPAFRSRIDLILPYYDLQASARKQVWKNFMQRVPSGDVSLAEDDFEKLAETEINGRDIKNTIKTAMILAKKDRPLRMKHLDVVLGIRKRVDEMEIGPDEMSGFQMPKAKKVAIRNGE